MSARCGRCSCTGWLSALRTAWTGARSSGGRTASADTARWTGKSSWAWCARSTWRSGLVRSFVVNTAFRWVASRVNMLYLAARTHNRAAVCLHAAHIAALWAFWTDWLPWHRNSVLTTNIWSAGGAVPLADELAGPAPPVRLRRLALGVYCSPLHTPLWTHTSIAVLLTPPYPGMQTKTQ